MLAPLWRPGHRYLKMGVMLEDLRDRETQPRTFFPTRDPIQSGRAMGAMDRINARYGRGAVRVLATGIERRWGTRQQRLSPRYTTRLEEILRARAL
jgi:DNA polymerase V